MSGTSSGEPARALLLCVLLSAAAAAAYSNSINAAFVLDDESAIVENVGIRNFSTIFSNPAHSPTVSARPLVLLTLAANYAISGLQVWSYHVFNLAVHIVAGLLLFGIVRRSFRLPALDAQWRDSADPTAFAAALFWLVHPLQTESVTYVIQRCESLMGCFFLAALYCAVRAWTSSSSWAWRVAAGVACALGALTKEVIIALPLVCALYEWCFLSGTIRQMLRRSWGLYLCFLPGLLILMFLVLGGGSASASLSDQLAGMRWNYLLTQPEVLLHYVRLSFWPSSLCIDYYWPLITGPVHALVPLAVIVALLLLSATLLLRRSPSGFLLAAFFAILAPTSSFVPICTTAVEHRMYLPLAALAVLTAAALDRFTSGLRRFGASMPRSAFASVTITIGFVLAARTVARNSDFRTAETLWAKTVAQQPLNWRARNNYGVALMSDRKFDEAIAQFREALSTTPEPAAILMNLGSACAQSGRLAEAQAAFSEALVLAPRSSAATFSLANVLLQSGDPEKAVVHYREALADGTGFSAGHSGMALALLELGQVKAALRHSQIAVEQEPSNPRARLTMATALVENGRAAEAIQIIRELLAERPKWAPALAELSWALATADDANCRNPEEAIELALPLCASAGATSKNAPLCLEALAAAYSELKRFDEAVDAQRAALGSIGRVSEFRQRAMQQRLDLYLRKEAFHIKGSVNNH